MSAKLTTDELLERLRYWSLKKEEQGFYAVMLEEVAVENGARRLDALVMNCVPSRGLTLVGYELKATRQDWLRELKRPEKADLAAEYLDAFYLVTVPGVVEAGELPDRWGLMLPHGRKNLKVEAEAKPQEGKDTPRQLLAGMLRKAIRQELEREVETRAAAAEEEARRQYERRANHDRECAERATEEAETVERVRAWAKYAQGEVDDLGGAAGWQRTADTARSILAAAWEEGERIPAKRCTCEVIETSYGPAPDERTPGCPIHNPAPQLEQRINRLERVVLELAARPLPGYDFRHSPWPPEGELGDIYKLHHIEGRDTDA